PTPPLRRTVRSDTPTRNASTSASRSPSFLLHDRSIPLHVLHYFRIVRNQPRSCFPHQPPILFRHLDLIHLPTQLDLDLLHLALSFPNFTLSPSPLPLSGRSSSL